MQFLIMTIHKISRSTTLALVQSALHVYGVSVYRANRLRCKISGKRSVMSMCRPPIGVLTLTCSSYYIACVTMAEARMQGDVRCEYTL